jgi:hypothetical protein
MSLYRITAHTQNIYIFVLCSKVYLIDKTAHTEWYSGVEFCRSARN